MSKPTTTIRLNQTERDFLTSLVGNAKDARFTTGISSVITRLIREEMARQAAKEVLEHEGITEA